MMRLTGNRIWIGVGAALLVAALVYAFLPKPVEVDLGTAQLGALQVTVQEEGRTRIKERYVVSAPLAGRLQRVLLRPGDRVEAGQTILASLEPSEPALLDARTIAQSEARVKAAEATFKQAVPNLERARTAHEFAKTELDRTRRLFEERTVSRQELDQAEQRARTTSEELKSAEFAVQVAQFELEMARAALLRTHPDGASNAENSRFEIRSPIDGRVLRVFQESATVVTAGAPLLELGDPANLEVEADFLSTEAVKIRPGAKVWLEHWGGDQPLQGRVRLVEPAAFMKVSALGVEEQRVWVLIDFVQPPEQRGNLGDAYRVEARVVIAEAAEVLKAPLGAVFRQGDSWAVFRVEGRRARLRPLEVGLRNDLEVEIRSGVGQGDRVILYPSDRIKDGSPVRSRSE